MPWPTPEQAAIRKALRAKEEAAFDEWLPNKTVEGWRKYVARRDEYYAYICLLYTSPSPRD